ncbi:secretory phospholipase A2 receptor-like [Astyanax mexicanus]|uniref:Secretory phospholipase A2 receptor-like n=1 Tax=Astyanax mexicanus TaxID=7994 RepID=A0A8T2LU97_ASTMX|nr:secretory phospholipase A2 receptor-like [Astyanax mexicanus]
MVTEAGGKKLSDSWIGLHRSSLSLNNVQWSNNQITSFWYWKSTPIDITKNCFQITDKGWEEKYCSEKKPFFCSSSVVLVKENKTWEEALEYCRSNYTNLAVLTSDNLLKYSTQTQTVSVWTGLRFMAGEWLWVNGEPLEDLVSLASCPAPLYRCAARNSKTNVWENRDCEEKLNFLCY